MERGRTDGLQLTLPARPQSSSPLYIRLAERIAAEIACGGLADGEALPAERILSDQLSVSRTTVRKALDELTAKGLIVSRRGSGNFVAARFQQPLARLSSFTEDMQIRGRQPGFVWVARGVDTPSPEEAIALGLTASEKVARLVRVRLADGEPMALERAAIAARYLPDPESVESSLYATLRERGLEPVRALQRLSATAASATEGEHLGIAPGSPVMGTVRHGYLADGRPIEFTRSVYRGDRYDFVAEMHRG